MKVTILGSVKFEYSYSPPHDEVETKGVVEHLLVLVRLKDAKLGNVEASERDPESAVRGESGGTESVTTGPFLNTGNDLGETTVAKGETEDDIGNSDVTGLAVEEGENEGGTGKTFVRTSSSHSRLTRGDQEGRGWQTCGGRRGTQAAKCPWGYHQV